MTTSAENPMIKKSDNISVLGTRESTLLIFRTNFLKWKETAGPSIMRSSKICRIKFKEKILDCLIGFFIRPYWKEIWQKSELTFSFSTIVVDSDGTVIGFAAERYSILVSPGLFNVEPDDTVRCDVEYSR